MRLQHFHALQPVCPVCRTTTGTLAALELAEVTRERDQGVLEGVLHCSHSDCQREYPIIDGIPLIIGNIRAYLSENAFQVCQRRDLGASIESILGDCCGAGSTFDIVRQHLSSYTWDHYGDLDPAEGIGGPRPGSLLRLLEHGLALTEEPPSGPIIDLGCSVGRSSFALAERYDRLVLGVDLNHAMLRLAQEVLLTGRVNYPRRRVGLVYDRRDFPVAFTHAEQVDFWACDATALPFAGQQFAAAVSLNLLDCVHSPLDFLTSLAEALKDGGQAVVACPYDWSTSATPVEAWLGGHSQRSADQGASEPVLRRLLATSHPQAIPRLKLIAESETDWHVRMHERSRVCYRAHVVAARTTHSEPPPAQSIEA